MTARYLLLALGSIALLHGVSYAVPSDPVGQQSPVERSSNSANGDQREASHPGSAPGPSRHASPAVRPSPARGAAARNAHSPAAITPANGRQQLPTEAHSTPASPMNPPRQPSTRSNSTARESFVQNERIRRALPVQPAAVILAGAASPDQVRHRGPNPAVIGGKMNRTTGTTGAINGTGASSKH